MRRLHYHRVDVFTDRPFGGNPLAVFTDGRGLSSELMQEIAREFNLSETTFVLPPRDARCDYRVRIFTPASELPMAGHPTVGTSYVLARERMMRRAGDEATVTLEEGVGPVPVRVEFRSDEPVFAEMSQPLPTYGPRLEDARVAAELLSLDASELADESLPREVISCGVPFLFIPLRSLEAARRVRFRADVWERALRQFPAHGFFVFTRETEHAASFVHSRMFAPDIGVAEDPATGSASGPLGCYLIRHGLIDAAPEAELISEQGIEMGRPSFIRIRVRREGDQIAAVRVGGQTVYMGEGFLELPD